MTIKFLGTSRNDWLHSLAVTYTQYTLRKNIPKSDEFPRRKMGSKRGGARLNSQLKEKASESQDIGTRIRLTKNIYIQAHSVWQEKDLQILICATVHSIESRIKCRLTRGNLKKNTLCRSI